jgi:hypothetical protein
MGRTVLPYSRVWEEERSRWLKFRRALRREDQAQFDRLFELARLHLQAGVYASQPWPLESMLLSMLLEHQKAITALTERLGTMEEKAGKSEAGKASCHSERSASGVKNLLDSSLGSE